MNNRVEVLRANWSHLSKIEDLWSAIARESGMADEVAEIEGLHRSLGKFDFLRSDSFWFLLALVQGEVAGYLTAARVPKADGRVGVLYIDEVHVLTRFRRQRVGFALLNEVQALSLTLGLWRIRLKADPGDAAVSAFYEAAGYVQHGDGFFQRDAGTG